MVVMGYLGAACIVFILATITVVYRYQGALSKKTLDGLAVATMGAIAIIVVIDIIILADFFATYFVIRDFLEEVPYAR